MDRLTHIRAVVSGSTSVAKHLTSLWLETGNQIDLNDDIGLGKWTTCHLICWAGVSQYLFLYPKKLFSYCPLPSQVHSGWSYWIDIFKFNLYCFAFDFEMLGPKHFWVFEVLFLLAAQGSWKKTYINPLYYPFVFSHHFDPFFASCNRSSFVVEWCHVYDPWAYATQIRMRWGRVGLEASKYVNMMIYTEFQVPLIIFNKLKIYLLCPCDLPKNM